MSPSRFFEQLRALVGRLVHDTHGGAGGPPPNYLPCPTDKEERSVATIGPAGGTVQVGAHRLEVPAGAVDAPVEFTMAVLPARMLKVRVNANGQGSFTFKVDATLTLSYGRCGSPGDPAKLRVLKIDPNDDQLLADLGGRVNQQARTVQAALEGLSVYTLGTPP